MSIAKFSSRASSPGLARHVRRLGMEEDVITMQLLAENLARSRRGGVARAQLKPRHALSNRLFQYSAGFGFGEETLCIFVDQEPLSHQLSRRIPDRLHVPAVVSVPFLE